MATATIISISGQAWARDEAGNLRELGIGDVLQEGETLITSSNGSVELDFGDGTGVNLVEGGQQVVITPEMESDAIVATEESSLLDEDLEALLAALDDEDGDLLELLDATAAGGIGGGGGGSHGFVRVARIAEETGSLSFETSGGLPEGEFIDFGGDPSDAAAEDDVVEPAPEPEPGPDGSITVVANSPDVGGNLLDITGSVINVPVGNIVSITITDQNGNFVETTAIVNADGTYSVDDVDVSDLVDGELTVQADAVDNNGNPISDTDTAILDANSPSLSVELQGAGEDGVYNIDEIGDNGSVTAQIIFGEGTQVGDTLIVLDGNDNELFNGPVSQEMLDDGLLLEVPVGSDAQNVSITATVSDPQGNTFSDNDDKGVVNVA
ncbi:retention module-containing protein, partial [Vreelandella neptunia]